MLNTTVWANDSWRRMLNMLSALVVISALEVHLLSFKYTLMLLLRCLPAFPVLIFFIT